MSLDHILLGMLDRPASGYDLGQAFDRSARLFWFAELSQIYPKLRRMEEKGLLTSRTVPSSRGPRRREYERTPAGTDRLHEWLRQPPHLKRARLEHVAQLYFLGELGDLEETEGFLLALRAELDAQIARFEAIEERHRLECGDVEEVSDAEFH
ncbi:MAG: PadR family transcriptional regulator, partial [Gemmatimonadota bacterium]|nr:PadR family transcriptional regulator [Gemmatimonadota bacterium]